MRKNSCGTVRLNNFHQYALSHKPHAIASNIIWLYMCAHYICSSITVIHQHSAIYPSMAHIRQRPWLVIICRCTTGEIVQRWLEYREFRYDHEWLAWNLQDAEVLRWVGVYAAVISPDNPEFEVTRTMSFYDPWF